MTAATDPNTLTPTVATAEVHPSTAALDGHPLHPSVVPLPIGMLTAAALSDVAQIMTGERFFSRASRWLLGGGIASGALAASLGLIDFSTIRAARSPVGVAHAGGNAAVLGMSVVSLLLRRRSRGTPGPAAMLTLVAALLLAVTGWLGGELSYRQRVGVLPSERPGRS